MTRSDYHHYVSKSFIKYWQPSYDEHLTNNQKSNGGVYIADLQKKTVVLEKNLQIIFSKQGLNSNTAEASLSKYIERNLGNIESILPKATDKAITLPWVKYRALSLLTLLQASRIPGNEKPLVNNFFEKSEDEINLFAESVKTKYLVASIQLNKNIQMFLNEIGFFTFPLFDFRNMKKVLSATETSDLWGVAVPVRPNVCILSISKKNYDSEWIRKNLHIFQTYSVGLKCKQLIVPPRLKDGGEMHSGSTKTQVSTIDAINEFRSVVKSSDDLIKDYSSLKEIMERFSNIQQYFTGV